MDKTDEAADGVDSMRNPVRCRFPGIRPGLRGVVRAWLLACLLALGWGGLAARAETPPPPEKTFRVAYLDSGSYWAYDSLFTKIRAKLDARGWGEAVVFPQERHYSLEWNTDKHFQKSRLQEVFQQGGFDLLLVLGTMATQSVLEENPGHIPIVGGSINDAVAARIVPSTTDSGADNFTTPLNVASGAFMLLALRQMVSFGKLGILYSDTSAGRIYAFVDDAIEVARENGFEILSYPYLSPQETVAECLAGVKDLQARGAEIIFLGTLSCIDLQMVDPTPIYDFLESKNIPTFAANDRDQVRYFATMGIINFNEDEMADFHAEQIIRILSGAKPRDLPMVVPFNFRLLINLEAVRKSKLNLSLGVLLNADEIYMQKLRWKDRATP
jgi:ABC-type uncharacterized transport system substrate-binding protein